MGSHPSTSSGNHLQPETQHEDYLYCFICNFSQQSRSMVQLFPEKNVAHAYATVLRLMMKILVRILENAWQQGVAAIGVMSTSTLIAMILKYHPETLEENIINIHSLLVKALLRSMNLKLMWDNSAG